MPTTEFKLGVVLTVGIGREENLKRTLRHLAAVDSYLEGVVIIYDGCPAVVAPEVEALLDEVTDVVHPQESPKHSPGQEQPRNVGVRWLREVAPSANHVWFLDSDLIFKPTIVDHYEAAYRKVPGIDRILIGPYEWLAPESHEMNEDQHNDIRWSSFNDHPPEDMLVHDLGCGLGCFSGNLVWPIAEFEWVGGFAPELHHGRCEDGELGLRAAAAGIPMSMVGGARAWHVAHNVNMQWCLSANARDVPLLNSWHPEVQDKGFLLTEADGARFDFRCTEPGCNLVMNCHDHWQHLGQHRSGEPFTYADPASVHIS